MVCLKCDPSCKSCYHPQRADKCASCYENSFLKIKSKLIENFKREKCYIDGESVDGETPDGEIVCFTDGENKGEDHHHHDDDGEWAENSITCEPKTCGDYYYTNYDSQLC